MEPKGSLPHQHEPAICPFPQSDQFSPCLPIALREDPSILLLSSHHFLGLPSGLFRLVYPSKPLMHLSGLPYGPHDLPPHPKLILLDLITRIIYDEDHRRNLAKSTGRGGESTMGIRNFNLWRNEVTKRGEVCFEPVLNIHTTLSPTHPIFLFAPLSTAYLKKLLLTTKMLQGHCHSLLPPHPKSRLWWEQQIRKSLIM